MTSGRGSVSGMEEHRGAAKRPDRLSGLPLSERVFFRDLKPYAIVESLDQLRGPTEGAVSLSRSVLWAPGDGHIDLSRPAADG